MTVSQQDQYDQINDHALPILHALLQEWFPLGRMVSKTEYGVANLNGDAGESLSINIRTGRWKEFAGGPGGYEPLGLYAHAFCGGDRKIAFKELRAKFGLDDSPPPARTKNPPKLTVVKKDDDWKSIVPPPHGVGVPDIGNATMKHTYLGPGGVVLRYVARVEKPNGKKDFYPHTYGVLNGVPKWEKRHPNTPMCLYGLDRLARWPDACVVIQEGEWKSDLAQKVLGDGWACVGWGGGSHRVLDHDYTPVIGRKVLICGDADDPGRRAVEKLVDPLRRLGCDVQVIDLTGMPKGWDLGDGAKEGWTRERMEEFLKARTVPNLSEPDGDVDIDDVDLGEPSDDDSEWLKDPEEHATDTEGVLPLGHDNGIFYYLSRGTGQIHPLTPARHTELELTALADPLMFWEKCGIFQKNDKEGWDAKKSARWMMFWCRRRGIYNPSRARGRGAWLDEDRDGNIQAVLNLGNRLLVGGESLPLKLPGSRYFYEAALPLNYVVAPPLTKEQAGELAELCKLFSWEKPIYGVLMAGWLAVAPICGALFWRPAIWITGGSGSGKSTLETLIMKPALGGIGLFLKGGTTEAGIRQKLGRDALPVMFDEAEAESAKSKTTLQGLLELNRQSSSEGGAEIVKGTQNQSGAKTYHVKSCFAFSSINPTLDHLADESRVSVLELTSHNAEARAGFDAFVDRINRTMTPEFCAGFVARSVWLMPVILDNARTFAKAVAVHLGSSRVGDQIGTLLAGAFSEISDNRVSFEAARKWVEEQDWSDTTSADAIPDEQRLLTRLAQWQLSYSGGGQHRTVAELIEMAERDGDPEAERLLKRNGFKFVPANMREQTEAGVWVSNTHPAIRELLKDTPWSTGWGRSLKRLPGAKSSDPKPIVFTKLSKTKAVFVPLAVLEG
jgi:putative DNA primase/helicase